MPSSSRCWTSPPRGTGPLIIFSLQKNRVFYMQHVQYKNRPIAFQTMIRLGAIISKPRYMADYESTAYMSLERLKEHHTVEFSQLADEAQKEPKLAKFSPELLELRRKQKEFFTLLGRFMNLLLGFVHSGKSYHRHSILAVCVCIICKIVTVNYSKFIVRKDRPSLSSGGTRTPTR